MDWQRCSQYIAIAMAGVRTDYSMGPLAGNGYVAPELVNGVTVAAIQNEAVKTCYYI